MSSIMTNASAMTALQTLNTISKNMATTQSRISTGMRVGEAADNAAYWSIATTMRSDNKANSVVQDALGLGAGKIDTAYTGINDSIEVVDQIKEKVLLAKSASTEDRAKIQSEIKALQAHLTDSINAANYAGSNLLQTDSTDTINTKLSVISSYNRSAAGAVTTGTIEVTFAETRLIDSGADVGILDTTATTTGTGAVTQSILTLDVTAANLDDTDFNGLLTAVEAGLKKMATGAAALGAAKSRVDLQTNFVSKLSDAIERGVGQLVDADMNEESARLSALQVQQQLGIQALSIANSNSQNILSLFR
ncbi:flagellin [Nitratireductor aquimarinus]|uniref:flagellin N-terminal helical domain-containing protein n=1 Tax=Nitratireductor aquimarinus TaxID=889300 RepID=UPI002936C737|nr:flagellin [Nitratireductor aquimarinus]MDV2968022.1 flagellin [Nitratireductor aquimarinus]